MSPWCSGCSSQDCESRWDLSAFELMIANHRAMGARLEEVHIRYDTFTNRPLVFKTRDSAVFVSRDQVLVATTWTCDSVKIRASEVTINASEVQLSRHSQLARSPLKSLVIRVTSSPLFAVRRDSNCGFKRFMAVGEEAVTLSQHRVVVKSTRDYYGSCLAYF